MSLANVPASINQEQNFDTEWTKVSVANHFWAIAVPSSSPPVVVGGHDTDGTTTADIKMYANSNKSWMNVNIIIC